MPFWVAKRTISGDETDRFASPNGMYWNAVKIFHINQMIGFVEV